MPVTTVTTIQIQMLRLFNSLKFIPKIDAQNDSGRKIVARTVNFVTCLATWIDSSASANEAVAVSIFIAVL